MVETAPSDAKSIRPSRAAGVLLSLLTVAFAVLHFWTLWLSMEGWKGLTNGWPLWRDDHPVFFYYGLTAHSYLNQSGTTAGYDPTFMAGYAKCIYFPQSSTILELVMTFVGGPPDVVYKLFLLFTAGVAPWLMMLAAWLWRIGRAGTTLTIALFVVYVWTDWPFGYIGYGMLAYFLGIPLGLVASGVFARFCESGRFHWWLLAAGLMVFSVLVHATVAMIVVPSAAAAYFTVAFRARDRGGWGSWREARWRHVGVWIIPILVLLINAFWWLPGIWLTAVQGPSGFVFAHKEGVMRRLRQIFDNEPVILRVLVVLALPGALAFGRRGGAAWATLGMFSAAGFGWGYLAGGSRSLDFLQPGRQTYAFYTGLCLLAGGGLEWLLAMLRARSRFRLDRLGGVVLVAVGVWIFTPSVSDTARKYILSRIPFLSSRPSPRLIWVVGHVKKLVRPGERLLYEEVGLEARGVRDPYQSGRFSGLLAWKCPEIEILGGPYLHAALNTNFTQFGEGKLFGNPRWGRDWFVRYARIYRPSAIVCWSPRSRAFCDDTPELVEVVGDDGTLLVGRIKGFEGAAVSGTAEVDARPGRLTVLRATGGVDGSVVLRYHSVPCLRADPAVDWEPVFLEGDPVPFIKMRPVDSPVTFTLGFPPRSQSAAGR